MQPSSEMQSFVNACELKHKTYLDEPGAKLKMKLNSRDLPLVLERTAPNIVRVAHERVDDNGQLVFDPAVDFFTGYEKWIAMAINQSGSLFTEVGRRSRSKRYVQLNATETAVKEYKVGKQKELAAFVKYWVRLLRSRGWHEDSKDCLYEQTTFLPDDSYDDDGDEGADEEATASTQRVRDELEDLLDSEGLLADEPGPATSGRRGGISKVTISSGKNSVTLTGKNHL